MVQSIFLFSCLITDGLTYPKPTDHDRSVGVYEGHRDKLKIHVDELMAEQPTDCTILWGCPKFINTP